ncbi:hypothetical protein LQW54_001094 [Pestalotiopsis sp. IQ-011]
MSFSAIWTQFFPPRNSASLTESNLPSQSGRVFIVTGGSSGLGYEISRVLYGAGGKVYLLTRSEEHAKEAMAKMEAHYSGAGKPKLGSLVFLHMDLLDSATVKAATQKFLEMEGPDGRLDVLFNNAGTGALKNAPPSRQGHEHHFAINSLGPYLLTRLLTPILTRTAKSCPKDSVRVIWPASILVEMMSPQEGIRKKFLQDATTVQDENELYAMSKTGNWFLASQLARRQAKGEGVVHIAGNPGQYNTNIWRHTPGLLYYILWPILRDPIHGANTYLWMAFDQSVTMEESVAGRYAICDGRWHPGQREDLLLALRSVGEGGSGRAGEYREWCEDRIKDFVGGEG